MEYGEAFFYNVAADLFYAAIYIGIISLYKVLEHAFFLVIGFGLIKFRTSVRQLSLNLYTELYVYKFAKFNDFYEDVAFIFNKAYECGFCSIIRHYKEVTGAVNNDKRH
jgi:glutathione peroxidase-family protein